MTADVREYELVDVVGDDEPRCEECDRTAHVSVIKKCCGECWLLCHSCLLDGHAQHLIRRLLGAHMVCLRCHAKADRPLSELIRVVPL